jgi:hypothetical protein
MFTGDVMTGPIDYCVRSIIVARSMIIDYHSNVNMNVGAKMPKQPALKLRNQVVVP